MSMKPIKITKGLATVTIYEVVNRENWVTYCLVWRVGKKRLRRAIADLKEAKAEAIRIATELADGHATLTAITRKELEYFQQCEKALGPVPLHHAVQFYIKQHP